MTAAGAHNEYSRGSEASSGGSKGASGPARRSLTGRFGDGTDAAGHGAGTAGQGGDAAGHGAGAAGHSSRADPADAGGPHPDNVDGRLPWLILIGALLAALLLIAAEFTTLYQAHLANRGTPIQSVTAGSHNSYAMIPIGLLGGALGVAVWRGASRPALLALGLLGVVALLIALVGDLPDAHAIGLANRNSVSATTTPNAGLYLETFGAILLIATSGLGFAMLGFPHRSTRTA